MFCGKLNQLLPVFTTTDIAPYNLTSGTHCYDFLLCVYCSAVIRLAIREIVIVHYYIISKPS